MSSSSSTLLNIPFEIIDIIFAFVPSLGYHVNHKLDTMSHISWNAYMTAEDIIKKYNRYHRNTQVSSDYYAHYWDTHHIYGFFIISDFAEMNDYPIDAFTEFPKNVTNISRLLRYITKVDQLLFIKKTVEPTMLYAAIDDCQYNSKCAIREKILEIYLSKDNYKKDAETIESLAYYLSPRFLRGTESYDNLKEIIKKLSILLSKQ